MRITIIILVALITSCSTNSQNESSVDLIESIDSLEDLNEYEIYLENLKTTKYDTTTINGKYAKLVADLKINYTITPGSADTLIDLNYDNNPDILIEYYGTAGSGMKNYIYAYLYDKQKNNFVLDTFLSSLVNPTFYFDKKIITSYYIANGGGSAWKYAWDGKKSKELEYYHLDINSTKQKLKVSYEVKNFLTGKITKFIDTIVNLPEVYKYCGYQPIIKAYNTQ